MIKPKALTSISLFFPCYNEEENVGSLIEDAVKVIETYGVDYEIVIVDDGSKDRTAEVVRRYAQKNPRVKLVQHPQNRGYGAALCTGFQNVSKDLVFMMDGDNQFHIVDIEKLFSKIDSADVVAGYRIRRQDNIFRRFLGGSWTKAVRVLFGLSVRDIDCAFKLFRRKALEGIELKSSQLLIHAEILARLKKRGVRIQEIGVTHYPRTKGQATATRPMRMVKSFAELMVLYWQIR